MSQGSEENRSPVLLPTQIIVQGSICGSRNSVSIRAASSASLSSRCTLRWTSAEMQMICSGCLRLNRRDEVTTYFSGLARTLCPIVTKLISCCDMNHANEETLQVRGGPNQAFKLELWEKAAGLLELKLLQEDGISLLRRIQRENRSRPGSSRYSLEPGPYRR